MRCVAQQDDAVLKVVRRDLDGDQAVLWILSPCRLQRLDAHQSRGVRELALEEARDLVGLTVERADDRGRRKERERERLILCRKETSRDVSNDVCLSRHLCAPGWAGR